MSVFLSHLMFLGRMSIYVYKCIEERIISDSVNDTKDLIKTERYENRALGD